MRSGVYRETGVDTAAADAGVRRIIETIKATWPASGPGRVALDIGYFANVVDFGGVGVAICADGVGTKSIIADRLGKYDTIGIDCVAMNVNDMVCVGARPVSFVDYIAVETADAEMLGEIAVGLRAGAEMAGVSISGGETAQLRDIVDGFDLVGMAIGRVDMDRIIDGSAVAEGDVVIGVRSSGVHSNGLTLARRALLETGGFGLDRRFDELGCTLGEELLRPTDIYVAEAMEIVEGVEGVKALVNITGDGLLNLARVAAPVGFEIDRPIEPHAVFGLIQRHARVSDGEMFEVFNMGTGFCYVVAPEAADATLAILRRHGREARPIGHAVADPGRTVRIPGRGLVGSGKFFGEEAVASRRTGG